MQNTSLCHSALSTLYDAACPGTSDYCSTSLPCKLSGDHSKWPIALLGSQLTRRLDVIKNAVESGCHYVHAPMIGPVAWAEDLFNLGRQCPSRAPATFDSSWRKAGKFLRTGNKGRPHASSAIRSIRSRLVRTPTPSYDDSGGTAGELQLAVHIRRGDLSYHAFGSDQQRWVPDDYYGNDLPMLVSFSTTQRRAARARTS